jgi:hypothetical protein
MVWQKVEPSANQQQTAGVRPTLAVENGCYSMFNFSGQTLIDKMNAGHAVCTTDTHQISFGS